MLRPVLAACALLWFLAAPPAARPSRNAVHIGQDITVADGQNVHDVVCLLCSVQLEGAAEGSLVVLAGNAYLDGPVHGNVAVLGGHVTLTGKARIGANLVIFGGRLHQDPKATIGHHTIVRAPIVFLPIILAIGVVIAALILLLRSLFSRSAAAYPPLPRL